MKTINFNDTVISFHRYHYIELFITFIMAFSLFATPGLANADDDQAAMLETAQTFIQHPQLANNSGLKNCPAWKAAQATQVSVPNIRILVVHHLASNPKLTPLQPGCPSGLCNLISSCNAVLNFAISNGNATQGKVLAAVNILPKPLCIVQSDIGVTHYFGIYDSDVNVTYDWDVYDISSGQLIGPNDNVPSIVYATVPPPYVTPGPVVSKSCAIPATQHSYVAQQWQEVLPGNEISHNLKRLYAAVQDPAGHWWVPKIDPSQFGALVDLGAGVDARSFPALHNVSKGFDAVSAAGGYEFGSSSTSPVDHTLIDWLGEDTSDTSIIGADNVPGAGMVGLLPGVRIYSVKIIDDHGLGNEFPYFSIGLDWVALHWEDKNIKGIFSSWSPNSFDFLGINIQDQDDLQCGSTPGAFPSEMPALFQRLCYFKYNTPVTFAQAAGDTVDDITGNFDYVDAFFGLINSVPGSYTFPDGTPYGIPGEPFEASVGNFPQNNSGIMAVTAFADFDGKPGGVGTVQDLPTECQSYDTYLARQDDTYEYQTDGQFGSAFGMDYAGDDPSSTFYYGFITTSHFLSAPSVCALSYGSTYDGNCAATHSSDPNVLSECKTGSPKTFYTEGFTSFATPLAAGYLALIQNGWFGFFPIPYTQQNIYKNAVNLGAQSNSLFSSYQPQYAPEVPLSVLSSQNLPLINGAYYGWAVPPIHNPNNNSDFSHGAGWVGHQ